MFGIACILGSVFLMSLQDAVMKSVSGDLSLWQIYVLRSALVLAGLLAWSGRRRRRPGSGLHALRDPWIVLRSGLLVLMYVCVYAAAPFVSLATIGAGFYTSPLFVALFSALLAGEPVRRSEWLLIAAGFAGVVVMLRPADGPLDMMAGLPVAAGLCYALAAVLTRIRCRHSHPVDLACALNLGLLSAGAVASLVLLLAALPPDVVLAHPFLLAHWSSPSVAHMLVIVALAAMMGGISLGLALAYQHGAPVVIAAFDYSYLVFAVFWGLVFFHERPEPSTVFGMALIAGSGLGMLAARRAGRT